MNDDQIQSILEEAETALAEYVTAEGDVVFNSAAHIVTGSKVPSLYGSSADSAAEAK